MPLVYHELHRLAHRHRARERRHQTVQSPDLVNDGDVASIEIDEALVGSADRAPICSPWMITGTSSRQSIPTMGDRRTAIFRRVERGGEGQGHGSLGQDGSCASGIWRVWLLHHLERGAA
jgi:hypothetical protein